MKIQARAMYHYKVVGADVVEGADVRIIERRDGAGFAFEALAELLGTDLDSDGAVEARWTSSSITPVISQIALSKNWISRRGGRLWLRT